MLFKENSLLEMTDSGFFFFGNYLLFNYFSVRLRALLEFYSQMNLHRTMFVFKKHLSLLKKSDSFLKRQI